MLGSSLPGARTTLSSSKEGRLKSGALSVAKRKQSLKQGLTPMVQQKKTVMQPQKEVKPQISKTVKGGAQANLAKQKELAAARPTTAPTIPTGMGTGMVPNSLGKVSSIVSKVSKRFSEALAPKKEQKKAFTAAIKKVR